MAGKTLYGTLGISTNASQETIRAAWERLSSQWDPARPHNADAEARRQYAAIQNAYFTLGNTQKRAAYDRMLKGVRRAPMKKTRWALHTFVLALLAGGLGMYSYGGKVDIARISATIKTAAVQLLQRKPTQSAANDQIEVAQQQEQQLAGEVTRVDLEREHSESLALKLETELASRQPLAKTPLSQL